MFNMVIFKLSFILMPATFLLTLYTHFSNAGFLNDSIILLFITSGAIAGKIIFDRYNQINALLTCSDDKTLQFAHTTSTLSSICLLMGFLIYFVLLFYNVDSFCLTALNLFVCGFGTLYMWMQNIISTMMSSIYCNRPLLALRQGLVIGGIFIVVLMAVCGTVSIFIPIHGFGTKTGIKVCVFIINSCSFIQAAMFSIYLMSFEADSKEMTEYNPESTRLPFDDACSFNNSDRSEPESLFSHPNAMLIKGCKSSMKIS